MSFNHNLNHNLHPHNHNHPHMLQQTGVTEGYYRRAWAAATAAETTATTTSSEILNSSTILPETTQPQAMEDRSSSNSMVVMLDTAGSPVKPGALRPPNELGHTDDEMNMNTMMEDETEVTAVQAHPETVKTQQRLYSAIQRGQALQQGIADYMEQNDKQQQCNYSCISSFCFRGMEFVIGTTTTTTTTTNTGTTTNAVYVMSARTRLVLQTLDLPIGSSTTTSTSIVSVQSNSYTGHIAIALSNGRIQMYLPMPVDPTDVSFGKYRWRNGRIIECAKLFYYDEDDVVASSKETTTTTPTFTGTSSNDERRLDVSMSREGKVLVAHKDQLAIFHAGSKSDIVTIDNAYGFEQKKKNGNDQDIDDNDEPLEEAELLWATQLPGKVVTAKISGDGQSIALVLDSFKSSTGDGGSSISSGNDVDQDADADGIHIFEHDWNDGSAGGGGGSSSVGGKDTSSSLGILYRPGPFLVHSAPVTRISFRGMGYNTSSNSNDDENGEKGKGNDLLLTYCESDCSARIYAQNAWNMLTEWTTNSDTRIDWVKGISAFSLGDLESQKKPKSHRSTASNSMLLGGGSRHASGNSLAANNNNNDDTSNSESAAAYNESMGKMLRFQSIPHNPVPSSNAGAWISEITFSGPHPAIRLSRLTYLKRGIDDWNPTLFESVSAFLPPGCVFRNRVIDTDESGYSIEGIWPAWNPWLSETTNLSSNESLRGSAMAFLGLSSGPAVTGSGLFGDSLFGGTQNPPSELRITSTYPGSSGGNMVILEFPIFGDHTLTSLELGNPTRSILSLSHLNDLISARDNNDDDLPLPRVRRSLDYDSNRLVAEIEEDAKSISLTWRQQGTLSFLPSEWVPTDIDVKRTASLLAKADKLRDDSLLPVPLALPSLYIPQEKNVIDETETICAVVWWSDEKYGGSPKVVALTSAGTLIVFEVPPPWSALEPTVPTTDKPPPMTMTFDMNGLSPSQSFDSDDNNSQSPEYEVAITPDPEYGLGIRLESEIDGKSAIAGSYKRHPITGDSLPAERTGMIGIGDQLLSANGINLENKPFDEIVNAVREAGAACGPGNPIRMKFRRIRKLNPQSSVDRGLLFRRQRSMSSAESSVKRRTMEDIIGVAPEAVAGRSAKRTTKHKRTRSTLTAPMPEDPEALSTICALFRNALSIPEKDADFESCLQLVTLNTVCDRKIDGLKKSSLLFSTEGSCIVVNLLMVTADCNRDQSKITEVGRYKFNGKEGSKATTIRSFSVFEFGHKKFQVVVCESDGQVSLLHMGLAGNESFSSLKCTFRYNPIFHLGKACSRGSIVRAYSIDIIATMQPAENGEYKKITIWESHPHPGGFQCESQTAPKDQDSFNYFPTDIKAEQTNGGNIIDFCFLRSGLLEPYPPIAMFSSQGAALLTKNGGAPGWKTKLQVSYPSMIGSSAKYYSHEHENLIVKLKRNNQPRDLYPHILPGLCTVYSSSDEASFLRSDWHPDTILAHICTDSRGVKAALKDHLSNMFLWLCKEGKEILEEHLECPLGVSPVPVINEQNTEGVESLSSKSATGNFMDMLSTGSSVLKPSDLAMVRELQSSILKYLTQMEDAIEEKSYSPKKKGGTTKEHNEVELPAVLRSLDTVDLRLMWALGEIVLDPPQSLDSLDTAGQIFSFSASVFRKITESPGYKKTRKKPITPTHSHSFARRTTPNLELPKRPKAVSSAAALSALVSNKQSEIVSCIRRPGEKFSWPEVAAMRIPFWERSDAALAKLSEEVGQTMFKETRDIMECAIFFLIARKRRTLRNLAATDQSDTGRTFFKFLTTYDFSSDRGRRAAEKNAYSLLRKNKHRAAAAFFLLSEPPQLKTSIETIATKMEDLNLAFLVARLMESPELANSGETLNNMHGGFASLGMGGLGGMLGGGGGFASAAPPDIMQQRDNDVEFENWKPNIGKETRKLLIDRILPKSVHDCPLSAAVLLWLGRKEEAAWFMVGSLDTAFGSKTLYEVINDRCHRFFKNLLQCQAHDDNSDRMDQRPLDKANVIIDFVSVPNLLQMIRASNRSKLAATLLVSNALMKRGCEISSLRSLLHFTESTEEEKEEAKSNLVNTANPQSALSGDVQTSIFDSFDVKPPQKMTASSKGPSTDFAQSSIFDNFDSPAVAQKPNPPAAAPQPSGGMQSSIFDDFDVPAVAQKPKPPVPQPAGGMQSSIFDDFDVPAVAQKPMPPAPQPAGGMQSSIFDDFDVPAVAQKPKSPAPASQASQPSGGMQSSIFDDFDVPPVAQKPKPPAPVVSQTSGGMQSSIFDDFAVPPVAQKNKSQIAKASGQLQSSIFDSFDAPATSQKPVGQSSITNSNTNGIEKVPEVELTIPFKIDKKAPPDVWYEWKSHFLLEGAARRLLREIASVLSHFHGDPSDPSIDDFCRFSDLLVSPRVSEVLQLACDSDVILGRILQSVEELCAAGSFAKETLLKHTIRRLGNLNGNRSLFLVVLFSSFGRGDLAENVVREVANALIQRCRIFANGFDSLAHQKKSRFYLSSQYVRREAARLSWQLESCLWLHRGGGLSLSGIALNEAIVAVRIGLFLAGWNRNFDCLEAMIRSEPDTITDEDIGRQLWTSLKMMDPPKRDLSSKKATSGGWEFLVDCKRSQATELLRDRATGTFIIRPHPDDHGVFTISFKTNLVPAPRPEDNDPEKDTTGPDVSGDEESEPNTTKPPRQNKKRVRKDDVVQHAIIRLSDSGFRCGSFGPFTSLMSLLEAVSNSLPFKLRFDLPPRNRIIKEEGSQTSPNAVFLRRLTLRHAKSLAASPPQLESDSFSNVVNQSITLKRSFGSTPGLAEESFEGRQTSFSLFLELMLLSLVRRQICCVAAAEHDVSCYGSEDIDLEENQEDFGDGIMISGIDSQFAVASRMLNPFLAWCRSAEIASVYELAPELERVSAQAVRSPSENVTQSADAIEVAPFRKKGAADSADSVLRAMIQQSSGVEFSTLRLIDGGECTMLVLFSKKKAIQWLISNGEEHSEADALAWLEKMEEDRVIESIDLSKLPLKQKGATNHVADEGVRYRFVDPWEVEALQNREGETRSASLGRDRFSGFSVGQVALSTENVFRSIGGTPLLELWSTVKGGVFLTKALASVHPPWERDAGGDLQVTDEKVTEPPPFINSIRQCLYRNSLFRRLELPQRFVALVQVELLDLKNLLTPGGSLSLTAYALLRMKRQGSVSILTNKARTLDSAETIPMKLTKTSGPNAPASWGSVVRFRFPLPEDVSVDGVSYDQDRDILFKGPPNVLQVSVYEKKLLVDHSLGTADISIDGLWAGGQLEEWVPLRSEKRGIKWFARVRLTLRFELMCLAASDDGSTTSVPSVGLQRIQELCQSGGSVQEDMQKRSMSSPDLMSYFEGIVYSGN